MSKMKSVEIFPKMNEMSSYLLLVSKKETTERRYFKRYFESSKFKIIVFGYRNDLKNSIFGCKVGLNLRLLSAEKQTEMKMSEEWFG